MLRPLAIITVAAICSSAVVTEVAAQNDDLLEGIWEGSLKVVGQYGVFDTRRSGRYPSSVSRLRIERQVADGEIGIRLRIRDDGVQVSTFTERGRARRLNLNFSLARIGGGASGIIASLHARGNEEGSWAFSTTLADEDTLSVVVWRLLSYTDRRPDEEFSRVAWGAMGELHRIEP